MPYPRNVEVRHRKNAAEWVMWCALWPVAWLARVFVRCGGKGGGRCG